MNDDFKEKTVLTFRHWQIGSYFMAENNSSIKLQSMNCPFWNAIPSTHYVGKKEGKTAPEASLFKITSPKI